MPIKNMSKQFRIIVGRMDKKYPNFPRSIPWELVEPGRAQAQRNHTQTLERLNERGGMCCSEIRDALEGKELRMSLSDQEIEDDMKWLLQKLEEHNEATQEARMGKDLGRLD